MRPLVARRLVPLPCEQLYALLADLRSHWRLAGRWVVPLELRDDGGVVRVRGPLGLRRTLATMLTAAEPPSHVRGEARCGRTRATISWQLEPDGAATLVTLRADLLACGRRDRALLALGGRRWMQSRLSATLERLG